MIPLNFLNSIFHAAQNQFTYIWTRNNDNQFKRTRSFHVTEIEKMLDVAQRINQDQMNVSFSMGLLDHPLGTYERAKSTDIIALPCFWCDIDVANDVHGQSQKLVPSIDEAIQLLPAELHPSIIVNSGYGIHAYWIFDKLFEIKTDEDRSRAKNLLNQLQTIIRSNAGEYFIDPTADLSRMLRLPGTINWKSGNKNDAPICQVIETSDIFFDFEDIEKQIGTTWKGLIPKSENPRQISQSQREFLTSRENSTINQNISQDSAEKLFEYCSFCNFCRENISTLSHNEFLDFFPNLLKAKDGAEIAESLCKIRFAGNYDSSKTRTQIESMAKLTPITCDRIFKLHSSCNPSKCIVAQSGKKSPVAILTSPQVKSIINPETVGEIFPNAPDSFLNLKIPYGFSLAKTRIIDDRSKKSKPILNIPAIITKTVASVDSDFPEFYEISFISKGKWRNCMVKPTAISNSTTMTNTLPNFGILVSTKQAGAAAEFFNSFIEINENSIPRIDLYSKTGWHKGKFILPTLNDGSYILNDAKANDSIKRAGSRQISIDLLRKCYKFPFVRLLIAANLAAPLLELVNCRNFLVDLICRSSQGKSTALLFANSIWGARDFMVNFNATANALEEASAGRNSLPTNVDEFQLIDKNRRADVANQIVHRFAEGEGKRRLNRDGNPKPIRKWHGIMLLTSEEPITSDNSFQGVKTRTLEVVTDTIIGYKKGNNEPEVDQAVCSDIWLYALTNYGWIGPEFIEQLQSEFKDDPRYTQLRDEFNIYFDIVMAAQDDRIIASYAQYMSAIACADVRIQKYFLDMDESDAHNSTVDYIESISKQLPSENSLLDTERAKTAIIDWVNAYQDHFKEWTPTPDDVDDRPEHEHDNLPKIFKSTKDPLYGYWIRDDLYIIPLMLDKALTDLGFSPKKIVKEWAMRGEIEVGKDGKHFSVVKTIAPGIRKRVIGLSFIHDDDAEYYLKSQNNRESVDLEEDSLDTPPF